MTTSADRRDVWGGPILIFRATAIAVQLFLSRTVLGRFVYAHGNNPDAARLTGLPTRPLTMVEYGLFAAVGYIGTVGTAGCLLASRSRARRGFLIGRGYRLA